MSQEKNIRYGITRAFVRKQVNSDIKSQMNSALANGVRFYDTEEAREAFYKENLPKFLNKTLEGWGNPTSTQEDVDGAVTVKPKTVKPKGKANTTDKEDGEIA